MSTFKGLVAEFPQIRIDYFRHQPGDKAPLACFLSHVHSDHLTGLESLRAPFVYCSAATREILLRLEKYHYRINFARGILESRNVTYDGSMRKLAKPLPLDTPTMIELAPEKNIRVTLIDANHCIGAVMFLIEGDGKAILYTGDIRAETWWVNSLVQNPVLLPYTLGPRHLDCIYLDTTFATKSAPFREFPSKAEGIQELLEKVKTHPDDTVFYFHSWTFGYENVWIALSSFLRSQIHLDNYRAGIYASLSILDKKALREGGLYTQSDNKFPRESGLEIREAPALCGFRNGNHIQHGCLTSQPNVRIHSCERGMGCPVVDHDTDANVVHIIPIVTRVDGTEIAEVGAGGGKGDLDQKEELDTGDAVDIGKLMDICAKSIEDGQLLSKVLGLLQQTLSDGNTTIDLGFCLQNESQESDDDLSLQTLVSLLSSHASRDEAAAERPNRTIRFPYSRHSSYYELCALVNAFKPRDVYPCTVDEQNWNPTLGMRYLFGAFCSEDTFRHDVDMMGWYEAKMEREQDGKRNRDQSQEGTQRSGDPAPSPVACKRRNVDEEADAQETEEKESLPRLVTPDETLHQNRNSAEVLVTSPVQAEAPSESFREPIVALDAPKPPPQAQESIGCAGLASSAISTPLMQPAVDTPSYTKEQKRKLTHREIAYEAALGIRLTWADYGGLVSTKSKADREEQEL